MTNSISHKHLDAMDIDTGGGLLLAASSLTNRFWTGCLSYFVNPDTAPNSDAQSASAQLNSGVTDVKWIANTKKLVAACDSGCVMLWQLSDNNSQLTCLAEPAEHDDIVSSVSVNCDSSRAVSASFDKSVKVWDLTEDFRSTASYKGHFGMVSCVACHPSHPDVFISCAQDGRILVWDLRKSKPASAVETQFLKSAPTCIAWQPGKDHSVAIGTELGDVLLQDSRFGVGLPITECVHKRAVYRLQFARHRSDLLASVSNDCRLVVTQFDNTTASVVYQDNRHQDFVQGVCWGSTDRKLWSCGWDTMVLSHDIPASAVSNNTEARLTNGTAAMDTSATGEQ